MKSIIILFALFVLTSISRAEVYMAHPQLSEQEFSFQLEQAPTSISFSEHLIAASGERAYALADLFAEAQRARLEGHTSAAIESFGQVIQGSRFLLGMPPATLRVLEASLGHLIDLDSLNKDRWQLELDAFNALKSAIEERDDSQERLPNWSWKLESLFEKADFVAINGFLFERSKAVRIKLLPIRYSVSVLSDRYQPLEFVAGPEEILAWKPTWTPLLAGDCASPVLRHQSQLKEPVVGVFSKACQVPFGSDWLQVNTRPTRRTDPESLAHGLKMERVKSQWKDSKLLWVAVAVGSGFLIHQQLKDKEIEVEWPALR